MQAIPLPTTPSSSTTRISSTTPSSSTTPLIRTYNLREQRPYSSNVFHQTWDEFPDADSEESDSDQDSDNISIDSGVSDADGYQTLIQTLSSSTSTAGPATPEFLEHSDNVYRLEGSDSDSSSAPHDEPEATVLDTTPTIGNKRKRKATPSKKKDRFVLTVNKLRSILAELRSINATKKVTDGEIMNAFLSDENLTVTNAEKKSARYAIHKTRQDMATGEKNGKSLDGSHVVFTFSCDSGAPLKTPTRAFKMMETRKQYVACTPRGKRYRLDKLITHVDAYIAQLCEEQQIPLNDVDGAYQKRYVSRYNDQLGIKQPSVTETLACMVQIKATKRTAISIAQFSNKHGLKVQGERPLLKEKQRRMAPNHMGRYIRVGDEEIPVGVFINRKDMIKFTLKQLIELKKIPIHTDDSSPLILHMTFNQGMDGAGSHPEVFTAETAKLSKAGHSLKSCQTFAATLVKCCAASEVQLDGKPDVTIGEVLYECHTPNSYKNTKVIALVMEAESYDLQKFLAEKYQSGLIIVEFSLPNKRRCRVYCVFRNALLDGKSRKAMTGRGGGYCYMCDITIQAYHTPGGVRVQDSFIKYNNNENLREYLQFVDGDGDIDTSLPSDDRLGWTNLPFGKPHGVVVTHAAINIGRWICHLCIKINVFQALIKEEKTWKMSGKTLKDTFKVKESEFYHKLKYASSIRIIMKDVGKGHTGGGATGNEAKKLLEHGKDILPGLINDAKAGAKVGKICELLYVVIRVLNTSKEIDLQVYKQLCHTIGILIVAGFGWARMNQTLHNVLAHSWEAIQNNDNRGLKSVSEEGIEALQKIIRKVRVNRAWLGSYQQNLTNTLETMQLHTDLYLNSFYDKLPKTMKKPFIPPNADPTHPGGMNFLKRVIKGNSEDCW